MKKQEVIDNNRLIAEFMGAKYSHEVDFNLKKTEMWMPFEGIVYIELLRYHSSFNWLMPVIEKIESIKTVDIDSQQFEVIIYSSFTVISNHEGIEVINCSEYPSRIDNTYKAVVQFIKWYNQQKA